MSNAGYGNHEEAAPTDRPGADLGGPQGKDVSPGVVAGQRPTPDPAGAGPSGAKSPTLSGDVRREVATPGDGAGPTEPQGDEVDPGVG